MTVTDPESHAHCAFADCFAHSFNLTVAVKIFDVWRLTTMHIDNTVNGVGRVTFCAIKGEVPAFAAGIAVVVAKRAIQEHAQSSIISLFSKTHSYKNLMYKER